MRIRFYEVFEVLVTCSTAKNMLIGITYKRIKKRARSPNVRECTKISRIFLQLPYPHL